MFRIRDWVAVFAATSALAGPPTQWNSRGPGAGGGIFGPASSPHDPNVMFITCDMSELFVTTNAAASWDTIHFNQVQVNHEAQVQFTSDPGTLRIGFVGRLEPYKGPHVLLEAMKLLPRDLPVKLIVAGSGTEPPYLRTLEAAAAGDDRIEFLGSISQIGRAHV